MRLIISPITKFINLYKNNIIFALLITLILEAVIAYLAWSLGGRRQTFGPLSSYGLICLSIAIASIAAITSVFSSIATRDSLAVTRKSLELTSGMIRPFVTVTVNEGTPGVNSSGVTVPAISFTITNTGNLPAEKTDMTIRLSEVTQGDSLTTLDTEIVNCGLIFPTQKISNTKLIQQSFVDAFNNCRIRIDIAIDYKANGRSFNTTEAIAVGERVRHMDRRLFTLITGEQSYR
ncbi:hypothetical protein ACFLWV_03470 [Chloroflexota bacterium]